MRFQAIILRLTGFSCPIFGVSWNPPEDERQIARRIIAFLEDRRVLYVPGEAEVPDYCVHSVLEMRRYLTSELQNIDSKKELAGNLMALRSACRKFLDKADTQEIVRYGGYSNHFSGWTFLSALGELRGVFGIHIAQIAVKYGLDVEDDLSSILPVDDLEADNNRHLR